MIERKTFMLNDCSIIPQDAYGKGNRQIGGLLTNNSSCNWYRLNFTCQHIGRFMPDSKRKIVWQFGALRSHGRTEQKCEVHEVELTWSLKSGKVKLVWNGKDLSRLVSFTFLHMPNNLFLEFEWVIPSGSTFRAIAHAFPNRATHQYELFIDGTAISLLFPLEILVEKLRNKFENAKRASDDQRSQCEDETARVNADILECCDVDDNFVDSKVECSLVSSGISKGVTYQDALRSDLYSSTLDLLRETLSSCVPYTEEMISRAIIYAFSDDSGTDLTTVLKGTEHTLDVGVVEADALGETLAWLQWNQDFIAVADLQDRKMEFLRKQVEWMVFQVRHSRLDALLASQILHRVATVLNLKLTKQPSSDTLLLWNLKPSTLTQDLKEALKEYGKITVVAVSKQYADFGFCRFEDCQNISAISMAATKGEININGLRPSMIELNLAPHATEVWNSDEEKEGL